MKKSSSLSKNKELKQKHSIGYFLLLSEIKPVKSGKYEVITSGGRVVKCYFENFLGNCIWEIFNNENTLNESVIAWRFLD
jgi:hypothetical protein